MLDKPKHDLIDSKSRELAGERFSANKQCELIFGPGSNVCPFTVSVSMLGRKVDSVSGMARSTQILYHLLSYTFIACNLTIL